MFNNFFDKERRHSITNLNYLFFVVTTHFEISGKSLDLFEFVGEQHPQKVAVFIANWDKESRLMVVGTNDGLGWLSDVDDFAMDG